MRAVHAVGGARHSARCTGRGRRPVAARALTSASSSGGERLDLPRAPRPVACCAVCSRRGASASTLALAPRAIPCVGARQDRVCCRRALLVAPLERAPSIQRDMAANNSRTVSKLSEKAFELHIKGHYERSTENWRAALAAAEAIGSEDCIVVAAIKAELGRSMSLAWNARGETLTPAWVQDLLELYSTSVAMLRRRRDAGTLMPGTCRPNEVEWWLELLNFAARTRRPRASSQVHKNVVPASFVGYDAFLNVCIGCIHLLNFILRSCVFEPGEESEQACLSFCCEIFDEGVTLVTQPRKVEWPSGMEFAFCQQLVPKETLGLLARQPVHKEWHDRLSEALARLTQSGMIEKRGTFGESACQAFTSTLESQTRSVAERARAAATGQLRSCALASCGAKEAHVELYKKCASCLAVVYCCREHQVADWPTHKAACKAARKKSTGAA